MDMDYFFLAYIDPGSGALLLQALAAGAVGALAVFRNAFSGLTSRFFGRRPVEPSSSDLNTPGR
jgi:hypothetical protein